MADKEPEDFVKNDYIDRAEWLDWKDLKHQLRSELTKKVGKVLDEFSIVSVKSLNSRGRKENDPSMANGSSGVLLSLLKYVALLRKEEVGTAALQ